MPPCILNLGTRRKWVVGYALRLFYAGVHWVGGWVGPRADLDVVAKTEIPAPAGNRNSVVESVACHDTDWAIVSYGFNYKWGSWNQGLSSHSDCNIVYRIDCIFKTRHKIDFVSSEWCHHVILWKIILAVYQLKIQPIIRTSVLINWTRTKRHDISWFLKCAKVVEEDIAYQV